MKSPTTKSKVALLLVARFILTRLSHLLILPVPVRSLGICTSCDKRRNLSQNKPIARSTGELLMSSTMCICLLYFYFFTCICLKPLKHPYYFQRQFKIFSFNNTYTIPVSHSDSNNAGHNSTGTEP